MSKEKEAEKTTAETNSKKTEILYNIDEIVKRTINDFRKIKEQFDNCTDSTGPSVFFNTPVWNEYVNLKGRGVKLRFITEITKENISYCKELMEITDLRHLDGVKGNFGIADGKDYGGSASVKEGHPPVELIRSNVKTFVDQQQFFFETLWSKSIPAEQKIKEIEEGIEQIKTLVLQNPQDIFKATIEFYKKSNWIKSYFPIEGINIINRDFYNSRQEILERYRQGKHKGIRWITSLKDQKDADLVKSYIDNGINIRHVKDLLTHSFALSDKLFLFTIESVEDGKIITNAISSNDKLYLDHYDTVFETIWKKGIDVQERIREIEEGYVFNIETIPNPKESLKFYKELLQTVKNEILIMLASSSAFFRIDRNIGYGNLEKLTYENIKVKILFPMKVESQEQINEIITRYPRIEFRILQSKMESFIGLTIIDKQRVLITEVKDDAKINYTDSIGATINIFGKSTTLSYASIFNSLWKQTELYEKIQIHDKMQQEFINTAAHELKTPIQPILGFSKIVRDKVQDNELKEMLDIIIKNTNRLKRLSEDILDVARIESNNLFLKKEKVSIWELLYSIIKEFEHYLERNNINIKFKLHFENVNLNSAIVFVDRNRIAQVISNLINNSIKFIPNEYEKNDNVEEGIINIIVEKIKTCSKDNEDSNIIMNEIVVSIKDNGKGIDNEIYPRLFGKFASKSFQGTGLGLYICKNIVKAHSGKIWAKNNEDGKGAIFSFSLPLYKQ